MSCYSIVNYVSKQYATDNKIVVKPREPARWHYHDVCRVVNHLLSQHFTDTLIAKADEDI